MTTIVNPVIADSGGYEIIKFFRMDTPEVLSDNKILVRFNKTLDRIIHHIQEFCLAVDSLQNIRLRGKNLWHKS